MTVKIDMLDSLSYFGIPYPEGKASFEITCPFCGSLHKSRRKTMNINMQKADGEGVYSCLRCNSQGGLFQFWKEMMNLHSNEEVAREIQRAFSSDDDTPHRKPVKKKRQFKKSAEIAPIHKRDNTYRIFLESLTLTEDHLRSLKKRGLPEWFIKERGYRSFPLESLSTRAMALLDKGCVLEGVPGFYKDKTWTIRKYGSGILIPLRNSSGRIQGLQIRMDNVSHGKYVNFSSNGKNEGTATKAFPHIVFGEKEKNSVIFTEGALKADVINYYTNRSVMSIPGVNCTRMLPGALKKIKGSGITHIDIAIDMDMYENPHVYAALNRWKDLFRKADLSFSTLRWDPAYKGLDDYFLHMEETLGERY